ncbi:MAG: sel1 repeat family protein [Desulfovibrio sp.]|jgi:TPR repeat protein|nr:sel1 repeat family protein [Desulfovibrio sp.]
MGHQSQRTAPGCTGGGKEAEELFLMALNYHHGINGMPRDLERAIKCYEESLELGNPKAAINLGTLYRAEFGAHRESRKERLKYMNALYARAIKMGCPDGYYFIALSYYYGWGVKENIEKGDAYMKKGAEDGGLFPMYAHGLIMDKKGEVEEAKKWLLKALERGFGLAGYELFSIYKFEKDYQKMIYFARQGAKLGDTMCMFVLSGIYRKGRYDQPKDEEYAEKLYDFYSTINEKAPPPLIEDFDERFPPKEVVPYSGEK